MERNALCVVGKRNTEVSLCFSIFRDVKTNAYKYMCVFIYIYIYVYAYIYSLVLLMEKPGVSKPSSNEHTGHPDLGL